MAAPNPPWPVARLTVRSDVNDAFREWALAHAGDPADILELMMTAAVPAMGEDAETASRMLKDFSAGRAIPWQSIELPRGTDVAILRMGPIVDEEGRMPEGGYVRPHRGVSVASTPDVAWSAGRGYWRLGRPGPRHLVISRLGRVIGVYRTDEWSEIATGRLWCSNGWLIDSRRRKLVSVDKNSGRPPRATDDDLLIARYFERIHMLGYPVARKGAALFRIDDNYRRRKTWGKGRQ